MTGGTLISPRGRPWRWLIGALLACATYVLVANLALQSLLRKMRGDGLTVTWGVAYTLWPGEAVVTALRVSSASEWRLSADRVELRFSLWDLLAGRHRVRRARVRGGLFATGQSARALASRGTSGETARVMMAGIVASPRRAARRGLTVASLTASLDSVSLGARLLRGGLQLELQGVSVSEHELRIDQARLALQKASFQRRSTLIADGLRGTLRVHHYRTRLEEPSDFDARFELQAWFQPKALSELQTSAALQVSGVLVTREGGLAPGTDLELRSSHSVILGFVAGALAKSGFKAQLAIAESGARQTHFVAPWLVASSTAEPGLELQDVALEVEGKPASSGLFQGGRLRFHVSRAKFRVGSQPLTSALEGELALQREGGRVGAWRLGPGSVSLPNLDGVSAPATSSPLTARLDLTSATLAPDTPLSLDGELDLSGSRLNGLLRLIGAPEPARWMLSRFRERPFSVHASVMRAEQTLWLQNVELASEQLHVEGVLRQSAASRQAAFILALQRLALGVRVDDQKTRLTWGADRNWLQQQRRAIAGSWNATK